MGTSHRQAPVRRLVAEVQEGLRALYDLPDGHEVVLGNGGSTLFWDVASFCLVEGQASAGVFGEFGGKFAAALGRTPWLQPPVVTEVAPGSSTLPVASAGADAYVWPHNETSTGACAPVGPVPGADAGALVLVDATSAAGGMAADLSGVDCYYFAPQKAFASDGGLWVALLSRAAIDRAFRLRSSRWVPESLDLGLAIENGRANQTLNTPAVATLFLLNEQLRWLAERGGLAFAAERTAASASLVYGWAERTPWATPFVAEPAHRSPVVATVDFEGVDAAAVAATLRANGVVDVEPYRRLGRNQLRMGLFPAVDPADVEALLACIDWVVEHTG